MAYGVCFFHIDTMMEVLRFYHNHDWLPNKERIANLTKYLNWFSAFGWVRVNYLYLSFFPRLEFHVFFYGDTIVCMPFLPSISVLIVVALTTLSDYDLSDSNTRDTKIGVMNICLMEQCVYLVSSENMCLLQYLAFCKKRIPKPNLMFTFKLIKCF